MPCGKFWCQIIFFGRFASFHVKRSEKKLTKLLICRYSGGGPCWGGASPGGFSKHLTAGLVGGILIGIGLSYSAAGIYLHVTRMSRNRPIGEVKELEVDLEG